MFEFAPYDLLDNDLDINNDILTLTAPPELISGSGSFSFDETTQKYIYTPANTDSEVILQYQVTDGLLISDPGEIRIIVCNTAPWSVGESHQVHEGEYLTIESLSDRDMGWDLESGFSIELLDPSGNVVTESYYPGLDWQYYDGSKTYLLGYDSDNGSTTIYYRLKDENGAESPAIPINIEVTPHETITVDEGQYGTWTVEDHNDYGGNTIFDYTPESIAEDLISPIAYDNGIYEVLHGQSLDTRTSGSIHAADLLWNDFIPTYLKSEGACTFGLADDDDDGNVDGPEHGTVQFYPVYNYGTLQYLHFEYTPDDAATTGTYDYVGSDQFTYGIYVGGELITKANVEIDVINKAPKVYGGNYNFFDGYYSSSGLLSMCFQADFIDPDDDSARVYVFARWYSSRRSDMVAGN